MTLNLELISYTFIIIVLVGSFIFGLICFYIAMSISKKKNFSKEKQNEVILIQKKLNVLENQHYMLNLDIEKSRQKLGKSTSFLDSLKGKTYNVDIEKLKKELEDR